MTRILIALCLLSAPALADTPVVTGSEAIRTGMGWRLSVSVTHPEETWDHYADAWQVVDERGAVIATRELMHPHPNEQPFTRSVSNVMVPDGVKTLRIRTRCSKHGWGEPEALLTLPW